MISLIAGKYKGKKLYHFNNLQVRPTQAKVRKSIFQILEPIEGLKILDLYAGIGTLGFESISRGADSVVFVENDRYIFKILKKNASLFNDEKIILHVKDVKYFLSKYNSQRFDIIFADPPYSMTNYDELIFSAKKMLDPIRGVLCIEMKKQTIDYKPNRVKKYGDTHVLFWNNQ